MPSRSCRRCVTGTPHVHMKIFTMHMLAPLLPLGFFQSYRTGVKGSHPKRQDNACTLHNRWSSGPGGKSRPLQLLLEARMTLDTLDKCFVRHSYRINIGLCFMPFKDVTDDAPYMMADLA